jgi:hypothetical protein
MTKISAIVIHYSATARGQHVTVEQIDQWHRARVNCGQAKLSKVRAAPLKL